MRQAERDESSSERRPQRACLWHVSIPLHPRVLDRYHSNGSMIQTSPRVERFFDRQCSSLRCNLDYVIERYWWSCFSSEWTWTCGYIGEDVTVHRRLHVLKGSMRTENEQHKDLRSVTATGRTTIKSNVDPVENCYYTLWLNRRSGRNQLLPTGERPWKVSLPQQF